MMHAQQQLNTINLQSSNPAHISQISGSSLIDCVKLTDALILNELIIEPTLWQVYNCKITTHEATQTHPLPFLYHYDTLSDELKQAHPLTPSLLAQFNTSMLADDACALLGLPKASIATPWQVKVVGTLVIFSERLQLALRLKFTNTIKARDPVYTTNQHQNQTSKQTAIDIAMRDWHFFGDVYILNKQSNPVVIIADDSIINITTQQTHDINHNHDISVNDIPIHNIPNLQDYQHIPKQYADIILNQLDTHKSTLTYFDEAIQQRLN